MYGSNEERARCENEVESDDGDDGEINGDDDESNDDGVEMDNDDGDSDDDNDDDGFEDDDFGGGMGNLYSDAYVIMLCLLLRCPKTIEFL